jgi:CRP-like cAMP-binding protein
MPVRLGSVADVQPDPAQLAAIPLLESLSEEELERVARWTEVRHADSGERICGEGAPGYSFFVIDDGTASVTRDGADVATLTAGDFFGELALHNDGRRTATVTATSPLTYYAMFGSDFRQFEAEMPNAAEHIKAAIAERLQRTA